MQKKTGLGRGLEALLGEIEAPDFDTEQGKASSGVQEIKIDMIKPNKHQPRKVFEKEKIDELAASIKEHGIIQPIIVRKANEGYEIVAGERRCRAAREAGLKEIPAIVRDLTDRENMIFAIIENLQREGLNPIDEAEGFQEMINQYELTQEEVSKSVGKSRPYITNQLRLLKLPVKVRELLKTGELTAGHGKVLISIEDENFQLEVVNEIIERGLSVRETEKKIKQQNSKENEDKERTKEKKKEKTPEARLLERELEEKIGTKINITEMGKNGKIEILYFSLEERDRIVEVLKKV